MVRLDYTRAPENSIQIETAGIIPPRLGIAEPLRSAFGHSWLIAPFVIILVDHDMEAIVAALFFGLNQAEGFEVGEVVFQPLMLGLGQATALDVDRGAGKVGGDNVAGLGSGIAVMATQLALDLYRAYRRVQLQGDAELFVVFAGDVFHEVHGPRTRKGAIHGQALRDVEMVRFFKGRQGAVRLQFLKLIGVLDRRKFHGVHLFVLHQHGFMGWTEERIPKRVLYFGACAFEFRRLGDRFVRGVDYSEGLRGERHYDKEEKDQLGPARNHSKENSTETKSRCRLVGVNINDDPINSMHFYISVLPVRT